jgi:hypothetical protein
MLLPPSGLACASRRSLRHSPLIRGLRGKAAPALWLCSRIPALAPPFTLDTRASRQSRSRPLALLAHPGARSAIHPCFSSSYRERPGVSATRRAKLPSRTQTTVRILPASMVRQAIAARIASAASATSLRLPPSNTIPALPTSTAGGFSRPSGT